MVVARQPGTASAFVPVLRRLRGIDPEPVVFACPLALAVFEREGLRGHAVESFEDAAAVLARIGRPSCVLTGTSLDVADDARWWAYASDSGARSVAFVDQWVNVWQRFALDRTGPPRLDLLPDVIAVIDRHVRDRLVALGAAPDRVVVTGSPAIDLLSPPPAGGGDSVRSLVGAGDGESLVLFASEPEPSGAGPGIGPVAGALGHLVGALDGLAVRSLVVVRPHPRQVHTGEIPPVGRGGGCVRVVVRTDCRVGLLYASDLVAGCESMLLFEAAAIGRPVVRFRLDPDEPPGPTPRPGVETVRVASDATSAVRRALEVGPVPVAPEVGRATAIFLDRLGMGP